MSSPKEEDSHELLLALELSLMDPKFRNHRREVSVLLAEGFCEFGSSGRAWNKKEILDLLAAEVDYCAPAIVDFRVHSLTPDSALVTYRAVRPQSSDNAAQITLRSSLWIYRDGRWRMLFHQGTIVPDTKAL